MKLQLICNYCDHCWNKTFTSSPHPSSLVCNVCDSSDVRAKKIETVDYYPQVVVEPVKVELEEVSDRNATEEYSSYHPKEQLDSTSDYQYEFYDKVEIEEGGI